MVCASPARRQQDDCGGALMDGPGYHDGCARVGGQPRPGHRHHARDRDPDGDRDPFAAAAARHGLGCGDRRGVAALRADLPVRIGIPDGAFRARADREATEGSVDSLRHRLRRRLCLYVVAQPRHGPPRHHHAGAVRARLRLRLLLRFCLCRLHRGHVADPHDLAQRRSGARATAGPFADPGHRGGLDRRKLSRPDAFSFGLSGLRDRGSPHARYSVLVLLHGGGSVDSDVRRLHRAEHAQLFSRRLAGCLHDLRGGADFRHRRRRSLRFDRLLRLRRAALPLAVHRATQIADGSPRSARAAISSISGTSSSSWRCAITPRCVSSGLFRVLRLPTA